MELHGDNNPIAAKVFWKKLRFFKTVLNNEKKGLNLGLTDSVKKSKEMT